MTACETFGSGCGCQQALSSAAQKVQWRCVTRRLYGQKPFYRKGLVEEVLRLVVDRRSPLMPKALRAVDIIKALFALLPCLQIAGCKTAALPQVQVEPTVDRPFIFIHQRKCGGSSVRDAIFRGAAALGLKNDTTFIPCYHNVSCRVMEPAPALKSTQAVLAGHFNWYTAVPDNKDFACLTTARHPVSRVNSCLSFVFPRTRRPHDLVANLTNQQFKQLLLHTHHEFNASCNNEALYMLSGVKHAAMLDHLAQSAHAAEGAVLQAISNLAKCTVLLVDEPSVPGAYGHHGNLTAWNARIMRHWFPWVKEIGHIQENMHPPFPAKFVQVVHELNGPEMKVYLAALQQYKLQQQALEELPTVVEYAHLPAEDWTPEAMRKMRGRH